MASSTLRICLYLLSFISISTCFKFAILNDIHLDLDYSKSCEILNCADLGEYN